MNRRSKIDLDKIVLEALPDISLDNSDLKQVIPKLAQNKDVTTLIMSLIPEVVTHHSLMVGDARSFNDIEDNSIHLIITSPPYWSLKKYASRDNQLGHITSYDDFLFEINKVWIECHRVLVAGGRLIIVVGDVCLSRRKNKRHVVFPLHASIQEQCRKIGFDNLAPIIWHKIANAKYEVLNGGGFLGKPYEPNAIVKNDIEYILMERKAGGYRKPTPGARILSILSSGEHRAWFKQIWHLTGASTKVHPAPFPIAIATRLIRMFSFVDDTVLDPFTGSGTTNVAAKLTGRNSIGIDIEPHYIAIASERLRKAELDFQRLLV